MTKGAIAVGDGDDDMAQINVKVPKWVKQEYRRTHDHGDLSRDIRKLLERKAFGEELSKRAQAERRIDEITDEIDTLRAERDEIDDKIDELETELAQLEDRVEQWDDREAEFERRLERCEQELYGGGRLFPDHGLVKAAANAGGVNPEDVIAELKDQNPDVPDHAFVDGLKTSKKWHGKPGEQETGE